MWKALGFLIKVIKKVWCGKKVLKGGRGERGEGEVKGKKEKCKRKDGWRGGEGWEGGGGWKGGGRVDKRTEKWVMVVERVVYVIPSGSGRSRS